MWTRRELKEKGKVSFKANYWKAVGVALVLTLAMTGFGSAFPTGTASVPANAPTGTYISDDGLQIYDDGDGSLTIDTGEGTLRIQDDDGSVVIDSDEGTLQVDGKDGSVTLNSPGAASSSDKGAVDISANDAEDGQAIVHVDADEFPWQLLPGLIAGAFVTFLIVLAFTLTVWAFILNPLNAGCRRFFTANLNRQAEVREIASPFDHGYVNCVKAMILRDVFTFLWTLLFIIPGIVKSYEYRLIPYLIADHPEMTYKEAFAESRRLMHGNKWDTFVLDLSFIGWWILSTLTLGILGLLYVCPYHAATSAALYEKLAYGTQLPPFAAQAVPVVSAPAHAAPAVDGTDARYGAHAL